MAAQINFPGQVLRQNKNMLNCKNRASLTLYSLPIKRSCEFEQKKMKMQQHGIYLRRQQDNKTFNRGLYLIASSAGNLNSELIPPSASDTIMQFYMSIKEKDLKQLKNYISEDCYIDDLSFPKPFQGKKEVTHFYDQLIRSMGHNMKFKIERVCEGDEFTAVVNWHLEWKETQIPFTRGCSFYECSEEGQRLVIKKARVLVESPIKPGGIVLTLLKNLSSLFDEFPDATEWFLKSSHVILQFLLKIYTMFLAPLIKPILAGYFKIWNLMAQMFAFALKVLIQILKIFSK